ncbi:MAG: transposase [Melioribacteraceae bacterium]|nr:transposase [Melioribacteraceae bacterium]MCF8393125.1 transposase [Melioribacteraceae bacterium]MCF8421241.1 transposase [Melioribacteraceae bacterium]
MTKKKIMVKSTKDNSYPDNIDQFDHYIALDWSMKNMSIARLTRKTKQPIVIDVPANLKNLKDYIKKLTGKKILTIEETTTSQWLYVELVEYLDQIVICDPYRNRLLSDGPKTDKIDAGNLCLLLKNGLLKEVYHTTDSLYELRMLVSAYEDQVRAGVRLLNQRSSIYRAEHKTYKKDKMEEGNRIKDFVLTSIEEGIELYRAKKESYEKEFEKLIKQNKTLRSLTTIPGIGPISSVTILSIVIERRRFKSPNHYLIYCGLVNYEKLTGGRSYGKRKPRYSRRLKGVYKSAAIRAVNHDNPVRDYYDYLVTEKKLMEKNAVNTIARDIAKVSLGIIKSGKKYQPYKKRGKEAA